MIGQIIGSASAPFALNIMTMVNLIYFGISLILLTNAYFTAFTVHSYMVYR
jgi:hypothetical protein